MCLKFIHALPLHQIILQCTLYLMHSQDLVSAMSERALTCVAPTLPHSFTHLDLNHKCYATEERKDIQYNHEKLVEKLSEITAKTVLEIELEPIRVYQRIFTALLTIQMP